MQQIELAHHLGLSKGQVSKLKADGMPVDSVAAALAWRSKKQNIAQRKGVSFESTPTPRQRDANRNQYDDAEFSEESFEQARKRREIASADLAEIEVAKVQGSLMEASKARAAWAKQTASVREALLTISARLGPLLGGEAQRLIDAEIRAALAQFDGAGV
jgi:hypothetical protein